MTTIALLRQTYLNHYLQRTDADTVPWTDDDCDQMLADAIEKLWPTIGLRKEGTVASSSASGTYTLPTGISRVTRIDVESSTGQVIDQITNFRYRWDTDPPTKVVVRPWIVDGYTLRFYGWGPMAVGTLPTGHETTVAYLAASLAFGVLASDLANSQRQQALDSGRVVDYQTAVGLSAYWRREYLDNVDGCPERISGGIRRARR